MNFTIAGVSLPVWVLWILIGFFEALIVSKMLSSRRILFMDSVIGIVFAALGGFLTTCYLGSTAMELFLISILGAIFFAGVALWITGLIFYKDEKKMEK